MTDSDDDEMKLFPDHLVPVATWVAAVPRTVSSSGQHKHAARIIPKMLMRERVSSSRAESIQSQ